MKISGPAGLLVCLTMACAETSVAPASEPLKSYDAQVRVVEEGDQEAPAGVPPEYQFPTFIHSIEPDAGWRYGNAWAQGTMSYTGTSAELMVTVSTDVGSTSLPEKSYQLLPAYASIQGQTRIPMDNCRGTIRSTVVGSVWNEAPLLRFAKWGEKTSSNMKDAKCPSTVKRQRTTTIGGEQDKTCYTLETDHYWYYPATGEFEYRYTDSYSWCEPSSGYFM